MSARKSITSFEDIVLKGDDGLIYTTSLLVAQKFKKRHDNVIQKIDRLPGDKFTHLNFKVSEYVDDAGKSNKMYLLTRDGFSYIAMGFTGKEAHKWKVQFIAAFNKMERHLRNLLSREWKEHRRQAALEYNAMCRTLDEVRKLRGKETKGHHYANEAKLVNWALTGEFKKVDRDSLSEPDLKILFDLEIYNAGLIGAGHDRETRKIMLKNRYDELTRKLLT